MTVQDVYTKYRIPPWLQMHQLRVAAVGRMLAAKMQNPALNTKEVVQACLFHDMGNILKIDFAPEGNLAILVSDEERARLRKVKQDFLAAYGPDEHVASIAIGKEIGLPQTVLDMTDNMRFSRTEWVLKEAPLEMQIAKYADLRVSPFGIVSMRGRFEEANARYKGKGFDSGDPYDEELRRRIDGFCVELEALVCGKAGIEPADITEASAMPLIEELRAYKIG